MRDVLLVLLGAEDELHPLGWRVYGRNTEPNVPCWGQVNHKHPLKAKLELEKTSKITKCNHQSIPTMPPNHIPNRMNRIIESYTQNPYEQSHRITEPLKLKETSEITQPDPNPSHHAH